MGLREVFDRLLAETCLATKQVYGERLVTLAVFGSVGRESLRPDSDIDLLLVVDELPRGRMARMAEFAAVESAMASHLADAANAGVSTSLSPVFKTREEVCRGSLLFLDMIEDTKILYDRDRFFTRFLERFRERLAKLGARRVWRGNAWYWVLKAEYQIGETFEV